MAHVSQQLQLTVAKHRTMESMAELTLGVSAEINGALQAIVGHCDLLERAYPDPGLQRDLAIVVRQAQRISALLDRMRSASHDQMRQAAVTMKPGAPPGG
jgi:nitrogen-specific signal transduction histidine kinase